MCPIGRKERGSMKRVVMMVMVGCLIIGCSCLMGCKLPAGKKAAPAPVAAKVVTPAVPVKAAPTVATTVAPVKK